MRRHFLAAAALVAGWSPSADAGWSDWTLSPLSHDLGNWTAYLGGNLSATPYWAEQPNSHDGGGLTGSVLLIPRLTGELDNGWEIGAHAALLVYRDELSGDIYDNRLFEKAYLSLQTQYGRVELGQQDGAAYTLSVSVPKVEAATAVDNASVTFFRAPTSKEPLIDIFRLRSEEFATENFAKLSYFSPRLFGVQLAGSFTPYEARDGLPFVSQGEIVANRQTNLLEAAANYDNDLGPFSTNAYAAVVSSHDAARTQEHNDLLDWSVGATLGYQLDDTTLAFGAAYRHSNAYTFDINEAFRQGATRSLSMGTTATTGPWIIGFEFAEGAADREWNLARRVETGFEPAIGYVVNSNLQLTLGWQHLRFNRAENTRAADRIALDAVFLHAGLHV